jgi:rare lipoprotein A
MCVACALFADNLTCFLWVREERTMRTPSRPVSRPAARVRGLILAALLALAGCAGKAPPESLPPPPYIPPPAATPGPHFKVGRPYRILGKWYYPEFMTYYEAEGVASWYGASYHGRRTANGEVYDMHALTAAHPTLQLPSVVRVTNLENGKSLVLRVNDRGPFIKNRLIDLSRAAARELGFEEQGLAKVHVQYLGIAELDGKPIRPGEAREYALLACELPEPGRLVC